MDKKRLELLAPEERRGIAVAYLMSHKDERPAGTEKLFAKLEQSEHAAKQFNYAMSQAQQTIASLESEFGQALGSIKTLISLIADDLPDEQAQIWCEKYQAPEGMEGSIPKSMISGTQSIAKKKPDIAGATAHSLAPPPIYSKD